MWLDWHQSTYLTNRTVAAGDFLHTFVSVLKMVGEAHVAPVAMEVVTPSAHLQIIWIIYT